MRRWLRRLGIGLACGAGLLVLALLGAYFYVTSDAGGRRIRDVALKAAKGALAGELEVRELQLHGDAVTLRGVTLKTPEGEEVARMEALDARVRLSALLFHTVEVTSVHIDGLHVSLRQDADGLNLSRALAPRSPAAAPTPPSSPSAWTVRVEGLKLTRSGVDYLPGPEAHAVELGDLEAEGRAAWSARSASLAASLTAHGGLKAPVAGPLRLSLQASGQGDTHEGTLELEAAGLRLLARGKAQDANHEALTLERLEVPPALARALLPSYPLLTPVLLEGHAVKEASRLQLSLQGEAGSARLQVDGAVDLQRVSTPGLTIALSDVNLAELLDDGPKSHLALKLHAQGGGTTLESLQGQVDLEMPASRVRGSQVGPVRAHLRAKDGALDVSELQMVLPGLRLTGQGHGTLQRVHFAGQLQATDLSALARTFGGIRDQQLPKIQGAGALTLRVDGPLRHPGLDARGVFSSIRYQDKAVERVAISVQLADIRRPLEANASLHARRVVLGASHFEELQADLVTKGRLLDGNLTAKGLADVVVHVGGTLDADGDGIELSELFLRFPEAQWGLTGPAHVRFPPGSVSTPGLTLASGPQHLTLEGEFSAALLRAHLDLQALDLALLPKSLVPSSLGVSGLLSVKVSATGRPGRPRVDADVNLQRGTFRALQGLELQLHGHYEKERAEGKLQAHALGARVEGDFDVPVRSLVERRHLPVRLGLHVLDVELGKFVCTFARAQAGEKLCAADGKPRFSGQGSATLGVTGTSDAPRLALNVRAQNVQIPGLPVTNAELDLASDEVAQLDARLHGDLLGGSTELRLETPLTLATLLGDRRPTAAQLREMVVRLRWEAQKLSLTPLHEAGWVSAELAGTASAHADLRGPAENAIGTVELQLAQLRVGAMQPVDVTLRAGTTVAAVHAELLAQSAHGTLVSLKGEVQERLSQLTDATRRAHAPFSLQGSVGPLALEDFPLQAPGDARGSQKVRGKLMAQLSARGRLEAPELHLRAQLTDAGVGATAFGRAELAYDYAAQQHALHATLVEGGGGTLELQGKARLDVSLPALATGLDLAGAPFEGKVDSDGFDVSPFSGLIPGVRRVGGKLRLHASVHGTSHAPGFQGDVAWSEGTLALEGYGSYDSMRLRLTASNDQVLLQELFAHSGSGKLTLSAQAQRQGTSAQFSLTGQGNLESFPIFTEDQLLATASLRTSFRGMADPQLVMINPLEIPEAHFELPDVKRKNLQELRRPDDIILVTHGKPADKRARAQFAAQDRALDAVVPDGDPPGPEDGPSTTRRYVVTFKAPRNLWVKSNDVQAEGGLSDGFRVEVQDQTQVFGEVRVLRGRADVIGRRFDLQKNSRVQFTGPPASPYVDLTAVYVNTQEAVKVTMSIRGQGKNIVIKPSSEPPLSDSEIYTLIATGRTSLKRGSGSSSPSVTGQAASALGSLVATELKKALANKLPLDVISIEAGEQTNNSQGFAGSVEAGRYFGDKFYVGYQGRIGADPTKYENSNSVRAEYQFSPRWSAEGEYGDARKGGLDLIWSRDY